MASARPQCVVPDEPNDTEIRKRDELGFVAELDGGLGKHCSEVSLGKASAVFRQKQRDLREDELRLP